MPKPTAIHAHEIIASFSELFSKECISSTVIPIAIVEEYYAFSFLQHTWISKVSYFQFFTLSLDFKLNGIDFRELDSLIVDVFPLKYPLLFSYLLANKGTILKCLLFDSAASLHSLDNDLALFLVGVGPLDLLESLVIVLRSLAVRVRVNLSHLVEHVLQHSGVHRGRGRLT
jgi:hypothetical protein